MTTDLRSLVLSESAQLSQADLDPYAPAHILDKVRRRGQSGIPDLAHDDAALDQVKRAISRIPTTHQSILGDARNMASIVDESVQLVLTSPPYWTLKEYPPNVDQLGAVRDYDEFLGELDKVWTHAFRVLVPGGRMAVVVGDVNVARRRFGRHAVFPLHSGIQEHCRKLGFDNLAPIIWYKIANAQYEANASGGFLGKPYEPNAVVKNDVEYILFLRKPGGYRSPSLAARVLSVIPAARHAEWFQQIWRIGGASTKHHPAPFPLALAERIVRMFSFCGDTVLDPFLGTGTTAVAAKARGRNSIGIEIEENYLVMARKRLDQPEQGLFEL